MNVVLHDGAHGRRTGKGAAMEVFPALDPIPLPAPVWLFKTLHTLTLALHFTAVQLLLGGLIVGILFGIAARAAARPGFAASSGMIVQRLPIVIMYVINLGVPPLLFTQVLYGRTLYTSSILIGTYWMAVVFLVMIGYFFLYTISGRVETGRAWTWLGLAAIAIFVEVARIYSTNMTLMLRPEAWVEMYRADPHGLHMPHGDPTTLPRWLYMMAGGMCVSGVGLMLLGMRQSIDHDVGRFLRRWGGGQAAVFVSIQAGIALWVFRSQPSETSRELLSNPLYVGAAILWAATAGLVLFLGATASARATRRAWPIPLGLGVAAFLNVVAMVIFRDGIRDVTLRIKGFDVQQRAVASNWYVAGLFLVLFVVALGVLGWMVWVTAQAKGVNERYAGRSAD
jgi:hypothetical protein